MANFVAGIAFVLPTYFVFKHLKMKKGLAVSLVVGTLFMAVFMSILNYVAILPAYTILMGLEPVGLQFVAAAILPFNLIKGIIVTIIFLLLYSRMNGWLNKQMAIKNI